MNEVSEQTRKRDFKLLLEEVRNQLIDAHTHFDIWVKLCPTNANVNIMNSYKGFFIPTRNAHLDRFFIKVSNTVDNDPRSPSFYHVLKILDTNADLAPTIDVLSLRKRLKRLKYLLRRIKQYRNKRAAHWDKDAIELDPVLVGESRSLLEELASIYNDINGAYNSNIFSFRVRQHGDTDRLLDKLR